MSALKPRRRGRPPACPRELAIRIIHMHRQGMSLRNIGDALTAEGIPTPAGRTRWLKSHVDRVLHTGYVRDMLDEMSATEPQLL